jgi:DeoR/GlpR family transcriptional regulator of sugar metabolism
MATRPPRRLALERQRRIATLIEEHGSVRASELTDLFGVAGETIRRDLAHLEKAGILRRLHGGAVAGHTRAESTYDRRLREHHAQKEAIAQAAAALVTDGSTIIIDSGTTTFHFVRALKGKRNLVVITTAVTNAIELMENPDITVVLTGGVVRPATFGSVGDMAVTNLGTLRVDQTYLAISGVSIEGGLTYPNFEEAAVKRAMISAAAEVILLVDPSKFGHDALVRVAPLDVLSRIITTPGMDSRLKTHLRDLGVEVIEAVPNGADEPEKSRRGP